MPDMRGKRNRLVKLVSGGTDYGRALRELGRRRALAELALRDSFIGPLPLPLVQATDRYRWDNGPAFACEVLDRDVRLLLSHRYDPVDQCCTGCYDLHPCPTVEPVIAFWLSHADLDSLR